MFRTEPAMFRRDPRTDTIARDCDVWRPMHFEFGPALLFCPADRPERFGKALERADAVILDLEDAVAPESKAVARGNLIDSDLDPDRVIVRVNPAQTAAFESDI